MDLRGTWKLLINKRSLLREITGVFKIDKNKGTGNIHPRIVHRLTMDCNETEANYVNWIGLVEAGNELS